MDTPRTSQEYEATTVSWIPPVLLIPAPERKCAALSLYGWWINVSCRLWPWILLCRHKDWHMAQSMSKWYYWIVFICTQLRHTGSFLPFDHPPDVIDYQPRFVPADHLVLFLGVSPQLHRTNNRPKDTQYQGGNHEEGNKPELYLYRRHLLLEFRGTDNTSWTKVGIRVCINLTNILGIKFVSCVYI